ncbi:MAG: M20/M25/M40 family metallo-hydrolase [Candidatus Promineifilaceae bacterium]
MRSTPFQEMQTLANTPPVALALSSLRNARETVVDLAVQIQQIPAPTFEEKERSQFVKAYFEQIGLLDVDTDPLCNVFGRFAGRNSTLPPLVVSAHSDTVFPDDTDLTITRKGSLVYGPGIADNSAGVAGLLVLANHLRLHQLQPERDIWFVANSSEEGLGDLRGMRQVVTRFSKAHAFIVVEGGMYGYILHEGIGVRRYRIQVDAEGGHSWSDFGRTSAIHILSHIISRIDALRVPSTPKTTYNVGVIDGGTSINTIAASAMMQLDLRSERASSLQQLVQQVHTIVQQAQQRFPQTRVSMTKIGDRPAGVCDRNAKIVKLADAALRVTGCEKIHYLRGSTDANIPLSRGFPAVCVGLGRSGNAHRLDEYLDTELLPKGLQQLLLLMLGMAG